MGKQKETERQADRQKHVEGSLALKIRQNVYDLKISN